MKKVIKILVLGIAISGILVISGLWLLAKSHNNTVHEEIVAVINNELEGTVSFGDLNFSYIRNFPNARIELSDVVLQNSNSGKSHFKKVHVVLRLGSLFRDTLRIKHVAIEDGFFSNEIDSMGRKPRLFGNKQNKKSKKARKLQLKSSDIEVRNTQLFFGNKVKGNRMYITVEEGSFKMSSTDTTVVLSGNAEAKLDSLISTKKTIIKNQKAKVRDAVFQIHRGTGEKKLLDGYILANRLKLTPTLKLTPHGDGNIIDFHILGDGNLNAFIELLEFPTNSTLEQLNPDAELVLSFNQEGFVNPFKRPFFHLDFKVKDATVVSDKFRHPLRNLTIEGNYNNGKNHGPETAEIKIDTLNADIDESFIRGRLKVSSLSDPVIDAHLIAELDLGHFLPDTTKYEFEGLVDMDVYVKGKVSDLKQFHFEGKEMAKGEINFKDIKIRNKKQSIHFVNGNLSLQNHFIALNTGIFLDKESSFRVKGEFDNLDQYVLGHSNTLTGKLWLDFENLNLEDLEIFRSAKKPSKHRRKTKLPKYTFDVFLKGNVLQTSFGELSNVNISSSLTPEYIQVDAFKMGYQRGELSGSGNVALNGTQIKSVNTDVYAAFKELNYSLPEKDSLAVHEVKQPFNLPEYLKANVDLQINKGILFDIPITELKLDINSNGNQIGLKELSFKTKEGDTDFRGNFAIKDGEISKITGKGKIALDKVVLDKYIKKSEIIEKDSTKKILSLSNLPPLIDVDMLVSIKDVRYKDQYIKNLETKFRVEDEVANFSYVRGMLPFGKFNLGLQAKKIRTPDITYIADMKMEINALNLNTFLDSEVFGIPDQINKNRPKNKGIIDYTFPVNWKVNTTIKAKKIQYKNATVEDVDLLAAYDNATLEVERLAFNFSGGEVLTYGFLKKENASSFPAYVYCESKEMDLSEVLRAFNNFKQDEFTYENSDGKISWTTDLHFNLIESINTPSLSDLWKFTFKINDAEFKEVQVIEETFSFIGHKAKDDFVVQDLDLVGYLDGTELLFKDLFINNNIANMDVYGKLDILEGAIDLSVEASLSDLLFRSKKKRMVQTREGEVSLDKDLKIFLNVEGPNKDRKIRTFSKKKFQEHRQDLLSKIEKVDRKVERKNTEVNK